MGYISPLPTPPEPHWRDFPKPKPDEAGGGPSTPRETGTSLGTVIAGVLIANLITGAVGALLYAMLH